MAQVIPLLQFTDRTRLETRLGRCPRACFLATVYGPSGYGIQRKRVSVPLASGSMLHDGLAPIMAGMMQGDQLPTEADVQAAVTLAHAKYDRVAAARGLAYWEDGDSLHLRHVAEQKLLIEGLIWSFVTAKLPQLHEEYEVIAVEEEEVTVLGCTCGIGDGIPLWTDHVARECLGIGLQTKADWVGRRRRGQDHYTYHEFKSFGQYPSAFASQWETKIQPYIGAYGWSQRTGIPIAGTYVHGLYKGRREKERAAGDVGRSYSGPEYQNSAVCYAWCDPGMPPLKEAQWAESYNYVDSAGQNRRIGKSFTRTGLDQYPGGVQAWLAERPGIAEEQCCTVGPLLPRDRQVEGTIRAWTASEQDESRKRWQFYTLMAEREFDWSHPDVQALCDELWPRSWQCAPFGPKHRCEFVAICLEQAGWEDPLAFQDYVPRRPHHQPELDQAIARGLLPPEDMGEEDED